MRVSRSLALTRRPAHLVQIVVLSNQLLQLRLNVDYLLRWELELDHWHSGLLQMLEESNFRRLQEHQAAALSVRTSSSTPDSVDVVPRVIRGVKLNNPVHRRNLLPLDFGHPDT